MKMNINPAKIATQAVKVVYLKMASPPEKEWVEDKKVGFIKLEKPINCSQYLNYYKTVGYELNWLDRLLLRDLELSEKINASNVHIYVMEVEGQEAGFLELVQEENFVEILYFGLFPEYIGRGLGKYFLNWAIRKAWSFSPKWIQLNTCELDHPNALSNYKKSGFKPFEEKIEQRRIIKSE